MAMLDKLSLWVDEIPPIHQPQRFGNQAFRKWRDRLSEVRRCGYEVGGSGYEVGGSGYEVRRCGYYEVGSVVMK